MEIFDERPALLVPDAATLVGAQAVDPAFYVEESVNALHRLQGDRRHGRSAEPAPRARGDVGEFEEASPGM